QRLARDPEQPLGLLVDLANGQRLRRVGIPPVQPDARVDADDVSLGQRAAGRRDAVHDLLVHGRAQTGRKSVQPLEGRLRTLVRADEVLGDAVELRGRDAWSDVRTQLVEQPGKDLARPSDRLDLLGRLEWNHPGINLRSSDCTSSTARSPFTWWTGVSVCS